MTPEKDETASRLCRKCNLHSGDQLHAGWYRGWGKHTFDPAPAPGLGASEGEKIPPHAINCSWRVGSGSCDCGSVLVAVQRVNVYAPIASLGRVDVDALPKPEPGSGATAARRLYFCGSGDCIGSSDHREELRQDAYQRGREEGRAEGAREEMERAASKLCEYCRNDHDAKYDRFAPAVYSTDRKQWIHPHPNRGWPGWVCGASRIRALSLTEAPEPRDPGTVPLDGSARSRQIAEHFKAPKPPGAEKESGGCCEKHDLPEVVATLAEEMRSPAPEPLTADVNDGGPGQAAYCHHRHHPDEHSSDFDTCPHPICRSVRPVRKIAREALDRADTVKPPPTAEELACQDCKEYRLLMAEKVRRLEAEQAVLLECREAWNAGRVTIPGPDFLEWIAARVMRMEGLDPEGCVELDYAARLRAMAKAARAALAQADKLGK